MSEANSTYKTCAKCGESKVVGDFYPHPSTPGALARRCKQCARAATMESRAKKRGEILERQRLQQREVSPEVRAIRNARRAEYRKLAPERISASQALNVAVRAGKILPLPCFVCGEKAEAHHPDYSRPLDVVWLCPSHHREAHALVVRPGPKPRRPLTTPA